MEALLNLEVGPMKGANKLMNIRRKKGGKVQRIPRVKAEELVDSGEAVFLSNTLYKAAVAGVEVTKDMSDQDIKKLIRKARKPVSEKKEPSDEQKSEKKSKKRQRSRTK